MKYFSLFFYSFMENGNNHKELIIRSSFFAIILFIFSKLWRVTDFPQSEMLVWYISLTEMIILSLPMIQFEVESDIRSGDIAYTLTKPIEYFWMKISEHVGVYLFRFIAFLGLGFVLSFVLTGMIPTWTSLILSYLAAFLAGVVQILFQTSIGLTAFKLQDCTPLFWIWQRSTFLLGGLLLPIHLYPKTLQVATEFFPFSALLYKPANLILDGGVTFFGCLGSILIWGVIALVLSRYLFYRAMKELKINGG